jgi:hypothetical protein
MKKAIVFDILFIVYVSLTVKVVFAQNITTGAASANSTVQTNIQGSGNVKTHIETTVNGQTNTVDSNEPGKIQVENNNGNVTISKTPQTSLSAISTPIATTSPSIKPIKPIQKNFVFNLFERFSNFLHRIFKNL